MLKEYGKKGYLQRYKDEMEIAIQKGGDPHDDNYFEIKGRKVWSKNGK